MNIPIDSIRKTTPLTSYPMHTVICACCFAMFSRVRISIKHGKQVVF